jgi:predicted TIM-barrel fold metal-dependent hydrolase
MVVDVHGYFGLVTPGAVPPARINTYAGVSGAELVLVSNRDGASEPTGAADLDEVEVNEACLGACEAHKHLVPVYWVRPGRFDSNLRAFAGAIETADFVGAMFFASAAGFDAGDDAVTAYLSVLATMGRPALFSITDDDRCAPEKIYAQARRQPKLPVVLCNCRAGAARRRDVLEVVHAAASHRDADLYTDTAHATGVEIRAMVQAVGTERVVWGTDALSHGDYHAPRHITLLEEVRKLLPPDDFRRITTANALRLFGLRDVASWLTPPGAGT